MLFAFLSLVSNLPRFRLFSRHCPGLWSIDSCIPPNSVSGLRRSDQSLHFSFEWLQQHTQCHHTLSSWLCLANLPTSETPPCEKPGHARFMENPVFQWKLKSRGGVSQNRTQARTCRRLFHPAGWFHHWNTEEWEVTGILQVKELRQAGRWVVKEMYSLSTLTQHSCLKPRVKLLLRIKQQKWRPKMRLSTSVMGVKGIVSGDTVHKVI